MTTETELPPPPPVTIVEVIYPASRGTIGIRGSHAPLSWETTTPPVLRRGNRHLFRIELPPGELMDIKLVRNEEEWAAGRSYTIHAGDHLRLEPCFDRQSGVLEPAETIDVDGETITFEVFLPPSYGEQDDKRYAVLYALDGQSLWSTSKDPYGVWHLDTTLDRLHELGAIEEIIVVGIETAARRMERLSPVADPDHGGGEAEAFLRAIVERVRAHVDAKYRTRREREHTVVMGSSMGGLFAFFAAWTRPDVFGKAACLSSSFWWSNRFAVRLAQQGDAPAPRPVFYIDSGAALSEFERDVNVKDGFHHTRAMFRALTRLGFEPGVELHRLVFTGATHDAGSWAARVAIPLQLLFPPEAVTPANWALTAALYAE